MVGTQAFANLWKPSRKDPVERLHPRGQRYIVTHPPDVFLQDRRNRRIYLSEMIVAYDSLQEERRTRSCPSMETFAQIWGSSALDTVWTCHWWLGDWARSPRSPPVETDDLGNRQLHQWLCAEKPPTQSYFIFCLHWPSLVWLLWNGLLLAMVTLPNVLTGLGMC